MITPLSAKTLQKLQGLLGKFQALGVDYIGHLVTTPRRQTAFFSHLEWEKLYVGKGVKSLDPYTNFAVSSKNRMFFWQHIPINGEEANRVIETREQLCHIGAGVTFYASDGDLEHVFALASSQTDDMTPFISNGEIFTQIIDLRDQMFKEHSKDHE